MALAQTDPYAALEARQYDRAIALFRERPALRKDLAYTLLKIGETEAARDEFADALRLDPADQQLALEYAYLCYETKRPAEARRTFDRLRKSGNKDAAAAFERIDGPLAEGIARWSRVVAQAPANFSAQEELARLAEQRDDLTLAVQHYERAWRLRPDRRGLLVDLGRILKQLDREPEANAALLAASRGAEPRAAEEAQDLLPKRYPYVYEFQDALKLDPTNAPLKQELDDLRVAMGEHPSRLPEDAKKLGVASLDKGYVKDAVRYLQSAHEDDPADFDVMLKLGWAYNILKNDEEAVRWFSLARRSPDAKTASEASRAYRNLEPALRRFRTTVWVAPMFSTRWHDIFAYAQVKTELRIPGWFLRPYASLRLIGDTRGAVEVAGIGAQYLSERTAIFGLGVATPQWRGTTGWFEAGESVRATPDYRGGLSYAKLLGGRGMFAETNDDGIFVSRFSKDTLLYSQNRTGYAIGRTQFYWNWNATVDALGQYWANFVETGPGVKLKIRAVALSVNLLRGVYLINEGNPRRPNYNDVRIGIWYAATR